MRPTAIGKRDTKMRFDPSPSIWDEIAVFSPLITDDMPITVVTPITTPSTVRTERTLLARIESIAMATMSFIT